MREILPKFIGVSWLSSTEMDLKYREEMRGSELTHQHIAWRIITKTLLSKILVWKFESKVAQVDDSTLVWVWKLETVILWWYWWWNDKDEGAITISIGGYGLFRWKSDDVSWEAQRNEKVRWIPKYAKFRNQNIKVIFWQTRFSKYISIQSTYYIFDKVSNTSEWNEIAQNLKLCYELHPHENPSPIGMKCIRCVCIT